MQRVTDSWRRILVPLALILALILAACGGGASAPATTSKSASPAAPTTNQAAASPAAKAPASQGSQSGEKIAWTLADIVSVGHPAYVIVDNFVKEVNQKSGGRLEITHGTAGELPYRGTEYLQVIRNKQVAAAVIATGFVAGAEPILGLTDLPFLAGSIEDNEKLKQIAEPVWDKTFDKYNARRVSLHTYPAQTVWTSGPVTKLDDIRGKKIRVYSPEMGEMVSKLGGVPVSLTAAEVPTALERKILDGVITAALTMTGSKWDESTKSGYFTKMLYPTSFIVVNKDAFNALPPDLQQIVLEAGKNADVAGKALQATIEDQAIAQMKAKGVVMTEMTPEDRQKAQELAVPIWIAWAEQVGPDAVALITQARQALGR